MSTVETTHAGGARSLVYLLGLQARARVRNAVRKVKTPKGLMLSLAGLLVIALWLGPQIYRSFSALRTDPAILLRYWPVAILALAFMQIVLPAGEFAVAFSRGEVDMLFGAPFTRRQLLVYRIARAMGGTAIGALLLSFVFLRNATSWPASFFSVLTSWWFVQLLSMIAILVRQNLSIRMKIRPRLAIAVALVATGVAGYLMTRYGIDLSGFIALLGRLRDTGFVRALLAPLTIFPRIATASQVFPDLVGWAVAGIGLNAVLVASVVALDINYLEGAVHLSERVYERRQQLRRSGSLIKRDTGEKRWQIPMLPWLGGAGPNAWRHLVTVRRQVMTVVMPLIVVAVIGGILYHTLSGTEGGHAHITGQSAARGGPLASWSSAINPMVIPLLFMGLFFVMQMLAFMRFDFRNDIEHMAWLKSLPLRPIQIVLGELTTPVLVLTGFELVLFGALVFLGTSPWLLLLALPWVVSLNVLLVACENVLFLLYPHAAVTGPGDMQMVGRRFLSLFVKFLVLAVCVAVAGAVGWTAYWLTGRLVVSAVAAWLIFTCIVGLMVLAVSWAFVRFDTSTDTPF